MKSSPRPSIRRTGAVVLLSALLVGATACGSSSTPKASKASTTSAPTPHKLTRVDVMLDWTVNTNHSGIYLARSRGWYRDLGLDVHVVENGEGADPLPLVGTGKVQFGISASEQVVPARAHGVPVVSVAAIIQHNTSSLMALRSSGISGLADLGGRKYGGFGGDFEGALVKRMVTCGGGRAADVKFIDVGNDDYRVGLTRHFYDFVWVFDAWDVIRLRDLDKLPVTTIPFIAHTDCIPDWYTPVLVTNQKLIDGSPDLVRRFLDATARGYRAAIARPADAAAALLKAAPELDPQLVQRSAAYLAAHYTDDPARWGRQDPAVWSRFVAFLEKSKLVAPGFDTAAAFTNSFLPAS